MRCSVMFITAVCLIFLLKLKWPKNKSFYDYNFKSLYNRPFPSSLVPLFQSESKCETIVMKMTLICKRMKLHAELIFIRKVWHLDSF